MFYTLRPFDARAPQRSASANTTNLAVNIAVELCYAERGIWPIRKMKNVNINSLAVLVVLCAVVIGCQAFKDGNAAADRAIEDFHWKYNHDRFAELADERNQKMKDNVSAEAFIDFLSENKAKYGSYKSSAVVSTKQDELGSKITVERKTTFEKGTATEKF